MQDLDCNCLVKVAQGCDEVWGFIGKKERHCSVDHNPDVWTYCAIDSETKLVPSAKGIERGCVTHCTDHISGDGKSSPDIGV